MLFTTLSRTVVWTLAAVPLFVSADLAPAPAELTYDGCAPTAAFVARTLNLKDLKGNPIAKTNTGIQLAECHSNSRVNNNVFSHFVVDPSTFNIEGAPYGHCTGFGVMPTQSELQVAAKGSSSCGFWTKKIGVVPSIVPGVRFINMGILCPSNLNNCYAAKYYTPQGPIANLADVKSTYTGRVTGRKVNGVLTYCECFDKCGCATPTYIQWASGKTGCDIKQCKPYQG